MDAVWDGRSDGFRDEAVVGFGDRSTGGDNFGANVGGPIVTNGEFVVSRPLPKSFWDFLFNYVIMQLGLHQVTLHLVTFLLIKVSNSLCFYSMSFVSLSKFIKHVLFFVSKSTFKNQYFISLRPILQHVFGRATQ